MKIAVWCTGHEIADTVANAVEQGLNASANLMTTVLDGIPELITNYDIHIGYGILRGMDKVYRAAAAAGKPWFCIDRGYWKPGHYDGYYRISLNGTQQTTGLEWLDADYGRWNALKLDIATRPAHDPTGRVLVCPPTDAVSAFFGLAEVKIEPSPKLIIRRKDSSNDLQKDLDKCCMVRTFNSSVGWEALRQGIPVISDPTHSFVGAYQKQVDALTTMDIKSRLRMFAVMASLQLTLEEIKTGKIWELMQRLINASSVSMTVNP